MIPNISKLLKILCVLPVSTAEPERFFSKLEKNTNMFENKHEWRMFRIINNAASS